MTIPSGSDGKWWSPNVWSPETQWRLFWHRGKPMAMANHGPEDSQNGPRHLTMESLSFPDEQWQPFGTIFSPPTWNEVLVEPTTGHGTFVEWQTGDQALWSNHWHWSSNPSANPGNFSSVSDINWWIPSHSEPCFSTCPRRVQRDPEVCIAADVPSLNGDRLLSLQSSDHLIQLEIGELELSAWTNPHAGHSLARIPTTEIWTTTPYPQASTPGAPNGSEMMPSIPSRKKSQLSCSPTIQLGGGAWDLAEMAWTPPLEDGLFELEYGVLHPDSPAALQRFEATWSKVPLTWTWKGTSSHDIMASPGVYVAFVQWRDLFSGKKGKDRCLVAVAPAR